MTGVQTPQELRCSILRRTGSRSNSLADMAASSSARLGAAAASTFSYLCKISRHQTPFYLWRPFLRDPNDDMVVEAAVTGGCDSIVTFNSRDFAGVEQFGIRVMTPREFLFEIGELE